MYNWKVWLENLQIKPYSALGLFILLTLPITLMLVFRSQDNRSKATAPDKLEAENGTLSSTGVSKQTDSGASGGSYVLFNKQSSSPTPTPSNTVAVPSSIDKTGATDASSALNSWLATVPDNSTIIFPAGAVYKMNQGLTFSNRNGLIFEGNGATLKSNGTGARESSLFYLWGGNNNITIKNFNLIGNSPTPGVFNATHGEHDAAITSVTGKGLTLSGLTISAVGGDGLTLTGISPSWVENVTWTDSHVISAGRMGIGLVAAKNVVVERVNFEKIGYGVFDIEPNYDTQGASNVIFRNNTLGTIDQPRGKGFFFGANGNANASISDVTVTQNRISGYSLDTYVTVGQRQNIVITNNRSDKPSPGPVLYFSGVNGLTITNNIQPLTSGSLTSITNSTNVINSDNITTNPPPTPTPIQL